MTWIIVILLWFLVPLALMFASEAYLNYQSAALDRTIRRYVEMCEKAGIEADQELLKNRSSTYT